MYLLCAYVVRYCSVFYTGKSMGKPTYTFSTGGTYTVKMKVIDMSGSVAYKTMEIEIERIII